jgi:hypothetical protein
MSVYLKFYNKKKKSCNWALVAHTCNSNYSGGRDQEDDDLRPAPGKQFLQTPSGKYPTHPEGLCQSSLLEGKQVTKENQVIQSSENLNEVPPPLPLPAFFFFNRLGLNACRHSLWSQLS